MKIWKKAGTVLLALSLAGGTILPAMAAENAEILQDTVYDGMDVDLTDYTLTGLELSSPTDIFNSTLEPDGSTNIEVTGIFGKENPYQESLGDLEFESVHAPWGAPTKDSNQNGSAPITIDGEIYEKGLAFQPTTMITIPLNGEYETFKALAGVDDKAGGAGSASFEFYVDKTFSEEENFSGSAQNGDGVTILDTDEVPEAKTEVLSRNGSPRVSEVELDVTGAQTLTI